MRELGRLITAMVTPFNKKGEVDYTQAKKLALALLKSGSEGLVLAGTTGESPTLVHEEELKNWGWMPVYWLCLITINHHRKGCISISRQLR